MRLWTKLGALTVLVGFSVGCIAPPPMQESVSSKPSATVGATSSAITKKMSRVAQWRIYESNTNVVVLGFGKDKKPVNGLRFRFASSKKRKWAVSLEMVKGKGALQIDGKGKVIRNTMTDDEVGVMFGATRVLEAWRKKAARSSTGTRAIAYADPGAALGCAQNGRKVLKDCGPVVTKCAGAAGRAALRAGRAGPKVGAIVGGAILGKCAWQNKSAVWKCGKSAYDNGKECYDKLTEKDEQEEKKNPPPEDKKDEKKEPEAEDAGTPEAEDAGTPEGEEPGALVASADEEDPALQPSEEEKKEDEQEASQDPENAPPEETVESEPATTEQVDPDPPEAQAEAPAEEEPTAQEPASEEPASEEQPSSEEVAVASFGLARGTVAPRAVSSSARAGGACGASRMLVCGGTKKLSYCRCVKR